jgi:23S rRNA (uracil1939-C5)-methyltransferase
MSLDLTLTTLSNGPDAIGRDPETGRAVFVPFAIPGEKVRAEIVDAKPTFDRARLIEVLDPSPDRVQPPCPYFGECGGCHYQHLSYSAQLKWKRQIVIDQLIRIGGIENPSVLDTLPSPDPFRYRNHVQFSQTAEGKLGFVRANLRVGPITTGEHPEAQRGSPLRVIPISDCPITRPEIMELARQIDLEKLDVEQIGVRVGIDGDLMLTFESDSGEPPEVELDLPISVASVNTSGEAVTLIGDDHLIQEINGRPFQVSASSFFQVNTAQAENLVRAALAALGLSGGETVLDLYSGVGLFTAFIAPIAGRVIGVESFAPAVCDAEVNLDEFENVELYESPVEDALAHIVTTDQFSNLLVLLDPPRAGCDKAIIQHLLTLAPSRMVYVSCDPATLARDAKRLASGGYRLISAQPVDMFPQTYHIETVAVFEK